MRLYNQKLTVRKILTSLSANILFFFILVLFLYYNMKIIPVWLAMSERVGKVQDDLQKVIDKNKKKGQINNDLKTDEGKDRYEKEFFNKLEDGEKLIILYGEVGSTTKPEENLRKMTWYETKKQDFLFWVHNLR